MRISFRVAGTFFHSFYLTVSKSDRLVKFCERNFIDNRHFCSVCVKNIVKSHGVLQTLPSCAGVFKTQR
nr:MAG TPA: hypothetical protein [Caudoviricetes sp.]